MCRRDHHATAGNRLSPPWRVLYAQVFVRTVSECVGRATGKKIVIARDGVDCDLKYSGIGTILDISLLDPFLSTLPIGILWMPISEPL